MIQTASSSSTLESLAQLNNKIMDDSFPTVATVHRPPDPPSHGAAAGDNYAHLLEAYEELTWQVARLTAEVTTSSPQPQSLWAPLRLSHKPVPPALLLCRKWLGQTLMATTVPGPRSRKNDILPVMCLVFLRPQLHSKLVFWRRLQNKKKELNILHVHVFSNSSKMKYFLSIHLHNLWFCLVQGDTINCNLSRGGPLWDWLQ